MECNTSKIHFVCNGYTGRNRKVPKINTFEKCINDPYLGICKATASRLSDGVSGGFSNNRLGASVS